MLFFAPKSTLKDAACVDLPEEKKRKFFGVGSAYREAKAICEKCPCRDACAEEALSFEVPGERRFGVWGGLTARERDRLYGVSNGKVSQQEMPQQSAAL